MDNKVVFTYNQDNKDWEFEWKGTIYSFDTFIEAAADYNFKRFES